MNGKLLWVQSWTDKVPPPAASPVHPSFIHASAGLKPRTRRPSREIFTPPINSLTADQRMRRKHGRRGSVRQHILIFQEVENKNNCVQIPFRIKAASKQKSIDHFQEAEYENVCVCARDDPESFQQARRYFWKESASEITQTNPRRQQTVC